MEQEINRNRSIKNMHSNGIQGEKPKNPSPPQPENHVPPEEERTKEGEEDLFTCLVLMKEHEPPLQKKF